MHNRTFFVLDTLVGYDILLLPFGGNMKINLSDDLLSTLANIFMMAKSPLPIQALVQQRPSTEVPPSPVGFRVPTDSEDE